MEKQKGFVLTRGMLIIIVLLIIGLILWVVTSISGRPAQNTNGSDQPAQTGEQEQQLTLTQEEKNDLQTKEDLARVANAVVSFTSNNSGAYPANYTQLDEVLTKYITTKPFLSPITNNSYVLTLDAARQQGVMNLERGTCNANKNGIVPTQNSRTYALLTPLTDKSVYCVDI
jgi:hypothetical protein